MIFPNNCKGVQLGFLQIKVIKEDLKKKNHHSKKQNPAETSSCSEEMVTRCWFSVCRAVRGNCRASEDTQ